MRLEPGTRLGHYEVVSQLGAGGMGVVYKAIDRRLDRTVAIKVLHEPSPELRQRFDREARVVAGLQHPRICTLIDVGVHDGTDYLVMEYLEGKTLKGPLPLDKVLAYGIQIADALDAAHGKGITHRDLKPDNVIVSSSGIKLLDFGIAKVAGLETVTRMGAAVGTPRYMAPEQWRGEVADARTDIFALGCVLHEMATGAKTRETPIPNARLDWVVRGCLAHEREDRWQSARDVKRLLESIGSDPVAPARPRRRAAVAALVVLAALGAALTAWALKPSSPRPRYSLSIAPPPNSRFLAARNGEGGSAVSPDGTRIVFAALTNGRTQLWLRRLDSLQAQPIEGTERGYFPFWSPDSQWIAFFTPDRLMRVAVAGGAAVTLCPSDPRASGGSWGVNDVLLIAGVPGGIERVPASGGVPVLIGEGYWPSFLPDGKHYLFSRPTGGIWVASIESRDQPRQLLETSLTKPVYSKGHLLFIRNRTLLAQPFDPGTLQLSGDAMPIEESIVSIQGTYNPGEFSVSNDGTLIYAGGGRLTTLVWRDRNGKRLDELASGGEFVTPRIAPDGRRVAFARVDGSSTDVWLADLTKGSINRFTFDPGVERWPIWSPDGTQLTYSAGSLPTTVDLYRRAASGAGNTERLTSSPSAQHPMDWSFDGKLLLFTRNETGVGTGLFILVPGQAPYAFLQTPVSEGQSQFSPDRSQWIAYSSDDSGRREIYVKPFTPGQPASDARWQISATGGAMPRWRGDGRELYYWGLDGAIMAATVDGSGTAFRSSSPAPLFKVETPTLRTNDISFDVTRDGSRFLLVETAAETGFQPLTVMTDWTAVLKKPEK
jgi:Tol biopolymer transport system component/predicted Ser/Thr protein kinase